MSRWIPILRWYFANYPKIINAQECFKTQVWPRFPPVGTVNFQTWASPRNRTSILRYPCVPSRVDNYRDTVDCCVIIHKFRCLTQLSEKKASWDLSFLFSRRCVCLQRHRDSVFVGARRHFLSTTCHGTYENGIIFSKKVLLYKFGCHTSPTIKKNHFLLYYSSSRE